MQDIEFKRNNVEYKLERYYSHSEKKIYEAEVPEGVHGEFGNNLKGFIFYLYYACRFINLREADFRLQPGSPAIDKGAVLKDCQLTSWMKSVPKERRLT